MKIMGKSKHLPLVAKARISMLQVISEYVISFDMIAYGCSLMMKVIPKWGKRG